MDHKNPYANAECYYCDLANQERPCWGGISQVDVQYNQVYKDISPINACEGHTLVGWTCGRYIFQHEKKAVNV